MREKLSEYTIRLTRSAYCKVLKEHKAMSELCQVLELQVEIAVVIC